MLRKLVVQTRERESKRLARFIKFLFSFFFLSFFLFLTAPKAYALDIQYQQTTTIGSTGVDWGQKITKDSDGNIYIVGQYGTGTVDFDPTGGVDNHTSNGSYDIFFTRYNADGSYAWTKTWGGTGIYDDVYDIAIDSQNNIYIIGEFNNTVDFDPGVGTDNHTSAGSVDIFLSKFTTGGTHVWTKTFGSTNDDRGEHVAIDSSNNVYIAGKFKLTVDFNPEAGTDNHTSAGSYDDFLSKYSSDGTYLWTKTWGGNSYDDVHFLIIDGDYLYTGGYFIGTVDLNPGAENNSYTAVGSQDAFYTKFDLNGNWLWSKTWGGPLDDWAWDLKKDANGNFYSIGFFNGTADFDPTSGTDNHISNGGEDMYVSKYDANFNYLFTKTWGGSGQDEALAIAFDTQGNYYIGGLYVGTVDFDPGSNIDSHTASGGNGFFLSIYDSNDNYVGTKTPPGAGVNWWDNSVNSILIKGSTLYATGGFVGTQDFDPTGNTDNHTSVGGVDYFLSQYLIDSASPSINLTSLTPDPNTDTTPSLTGTATDVLGAVSAVQYQMDSTAGSWTSCTADDGIFNGVSEVFICNVSTTQSDGSHTIYVRSTDSNGNTTSSGSESTDSFTIDTVSSTSPTLDSPSGYSKDFTKPTLVFKKATDATSGIASYSVSLDSGKTINYSTTGIPSSGTGVWKDDTSVKVEFVGTDEIRVYFKGLDSSELTEGKHSWKVTAYDNAGNSKEESKNFYLDKTSPSISDLAIADLSAISSGEQYQLKSDQRTPSFSGKATDFYQGSEKTNSNGTKDTFDKVSSGPQTLTLTLKRKDDQGNYLDHLTKEYSLADIKDDPTNEKYSRFYITVPYPLIDGYYQVNLNLKDQVGNSYPYPIFYMVLNYTQPTGLKTEITNQEQIPAETEEEKEQIKQQGYIVQVKVVDKNNQPIIHAKVEIHSDPMTAYTDQQGIVLFKNVSKSDHTIKIAYANFKGEQKITLEGDNTKQFSFDIRVTEEIKTPFFKEPVFLILAIVFLCSLVFSFFFFWSKKKKVN